MAKICVVADPVHSSTLLSFCAGAPCCFSKQGACQSTVGNTLTMEKRLVHPHFSCHFYIIPNFLSPGRKRFSSKSLSERSEGVWSGDGAVSLSLPHLLYETDKAMPNRMMDSTCLHSRSTHRALFV